MRLVVVKERRREKPMQKILYRLLFAIFLVINGVSGHADTETLQWYVDNDLYATTTCESGGDIVLPTPPTKYGYRFQGWAGYTPIEYLASTGTQYIDTGYRPNNTTRTVFAVQMLPQSPVSVMGSRTAMGNAAFAINIYSSGNETVASYYGDEQKYFCNNMKPNIIFIFDKDKNITNIYDSNNQILCTLSHSVQTFQTAPTLTIFTAQAPLIIQESISYSRIYYFKIYDNDILVRDMIPVLDSNNIPCMYDLVEDKYYYNAGTGDFIAGPMIYVQ